MTIYLDIVFFENVIMNFLIIFATAIISKSKISPPRMLLAASVRRYIFNNYIYNKINKFSKFSLKNNYFNTYRKNILQTNQNKVFNTKFNVFLFCITSIWWKCIYAFIFCITRKCFVQRWCFDWHLSIKSHFSWCWFGFCANSE